MNILNDIKFGKFIIVVEEFFRGCFAGEVFDGGI